MAKNASWGRPTLRSRARGMCRAPVRANRLYGGQGWEPGDHTSSGEHYQWLTVSIVSVEIVQNDPIIDKP